MGRNMNFRALFVLRTALMLAAAPVMAQDRPDTVLALADDGALDLSAVHAIWNVSAGELRKRGLSVSGDRRLEETRAVDARLSQLVAELGARRLFVLRIGGRLGQKIPLSLEEVNPVNLTSIYSSQLTAFGLEECDVVASRLVDSVVSRVPVESTAQLKTVTSAESKPFSKKPGERFWFIGLPVALFGAGNGKSPLGFSLGYGYEAEAFRISASAGVFGRGTEATSYLSLEGVWLPLQGEFSPFVGGGLGYMSANTSGGMGAVAEAGIEAFRLHGVRALLGLQVTIPFFDNGNLDHPSRPFFPAAFGRLAF